MAGANEINHALNGFQLWAASLPSATVIDTASGFTSDQAKLLAEHFKHIFFVPELELDDLPKLRGK